MSEVSPVPHNAIDRTTPARDGFMAMMIIFGFFLSSVNFMVAWGYYAMVHESNWQRRRSNSTLRWLSSVFVALPIWTFMVIMPFAGGWIVTPLVKQVCFYFVEFWVSF